MNKLLLAVGLGVALAFSAVEAKAQDASTYTIGSYSGGTNNLAAGVSNSVTFTVSEFRSFDLQLSFSGQTSGSTSNMLVQGFRSVDSTLYESTPSFSYIYAANSTLTNTYYTNISVGDASTYKLVFVNTNAGTLANFTNIIAKRKFKASKQLAVPPGSK